MAICFCYNEKFVRNVVIKTGISIGSEEWVPLKAQPRVTVKRDKVTDVVVHLMGGGGGDEEVDDDQVVEMRKRAEELAAKAKKAGSSADNLLFIVMVHGYMCV
ncbi:hypothetical protein FNV43_RR22525 [Rhamnella rubrinervis]|uniref:Uncharacterized protein n=1 Tax=Rhamnella rubrinervis TaxID=2594499 RepID=A0A8K0DVD9_9ROSA|nr:hypothetical protein FNV43_RR22525 [Rhamnella rubrinervis]